MPRKRSENPSPQALYMRAYRERKVTPEILRAREIRQKVLAFRENPKYQQGFKQAERRRRRDVYRAWQVVKAGHALSFRGDLVTTEEAVHILERGGRVNLLEARTRRESKPDYKPRKGRPKRKHLDTQQGINAALRKAAFEHGIQPLSADLGNPEYNDRETFGRKVIRDESPSTPAPEPATTRVPFNGDKAKQDLMVAALKAKIGFVSQEELDSHDPFGSFKYSIDGQ